MKDTPRLSYINQKTEDQLNELWENTFAGEENNNFIHAHVPKEYAVPNKSSLIYYVGNNKRLWLIKRIQENDIIGYVVHGNIGGLQNNIGIAIGKRFSNMGYGLEACQELLKTIKEEGYSEIFAQCMASNTPVISLLTKLKFENLGATGIKFDNINELKFRLELNQ